MGNMYLIPANSKSGQLIFNFMRPIDLVVFLVGLALTIILFLVIGASSLTATVIKLIPVCLGGLLVVPVAHYHNVMEFAKDGIKFAFSRRIYYWRGWCVRNEYGEE